MMTLEEHMQMTWKMRMHTPACTLRLPSHLQCGYSHYIYALVRGWKIFSFDAVRLDLGRQSFSFYLACSHQNILATHRKSMKHMVEKHNIRTEKSCRWFFPGTSSIPYRKDYSHIWEYGRPPWSHWFCIQNCITVIWDAALKLGERWTPVTTPLPPSKD